MGRKLTDFVTSYHKHNGAATQYLQLCSLLHKIWSEC